MIDDLNREDLDALIEARTERLQAEHDAQQERAIDPMLRYDNTDIAWLVLETTMGPGGEYFTGYEVRARWNRPEEPLSYDFETAICTFAGPSVRFPDWERRLVAIGLSAESAMAVVKARNLAVLGHE